MTNEEIASGYVEHVTRKADRQEAIDEMYDISISDARRTWEIISLVLRQSAGDVKMASVIDGRLAVGPLEEMMLHCDECLCDEIMDEAGQSERIANLLNFVDSQYLFPGLRSKIFSSQKEPRSLNKEIHATPFASDA